MAFVPAAHVKGTFEVVVEELVEVLNAIDEKVCEKAVDFELTSKQPTSKIFNSLATPPMFPINIWNLHKAAVDGLARKNNAGEGWHYGIQYFSAGVRLAFGRFWKNYKKMPK